MSLRRVALVATAAWLGLALVTGQAGAAPRSSPTAPANLRITASTSASVTLAWDAPRSGTAISYYYVLDQLRWNYFIVTAPQTTFTQNRLAPNSNYSWVVRAVDTKGNGSADSNAVTYRTPADVTAPSTPVLSAPFVGPKRVELDWTDAVDDTSQVSYSVSVNGSPASGPTESHLVLPLAPSGSYSISVTARDRWGNATTSNTISVTTPVADNVSPPSAPPGFIGFESGGCEGWLRWNASTDDVDPSSAILYKAFVNGQFDSEAFGLTSTIVYATQNGTNTFSIVAVDSSGNESAPSVLEIPNMQLC